MKIVYTSLGFALGASAASLVARDQCCFGLTASGGVSGSVGQLSDGQNRIAQTAGLDKQNGQYCINNGQITDGNGRGCILTPPTTQFQCDEGATPTGGFSVNNGNVEYNGSDQFYACPTGDNGGYNIYTTPVENQQGCVEITLSTGGKCSGSGSSSASASSAPASSAPASSAPASSAPASSAPASSAPASSAPASSAPASSAPASSAPASSAPATTAPALTQTIYSTHYETITSCGASVTDCPASSTVVQSTVYSSVAPSAPASSAPAASAPASSAPAASAPASSAPASSAPASSAPASSAPASSAPAASAPASSAPASSAPASSAPASSAPASSAPASSAPASSAPASSAPAATTTAPSATTGTGSACATTLGGAYQTPHAIIPVNEGSPDQSYGTQYFAYLGGGNSTIFNFDIPTSYSGKQCTLIFLFPEQKDLETSSFTESGSGGLTFSHLASAAGLNVSYDSAPKADVQLGQIDNVAPGNSYVVYSGACQAGTTQSVEVSASGDYELSFFEDWNPSPIGVFVTAC